MFRALVFFTYFWLYLFYSIPTLNKVKSLHKQNRQEESERIANEIASKWSRVLVKISGTKVILEGEENIPRNEPVLFVSNHQSNFDIPIFIGYINKPKGFIAKKEIEKLPIVREWMEYLKCVYIDRNDVRQSLKAINQGAENLKAGFSMVVFPEGTRSEDGTMADFKPGSLKLAIKANVPIVPITINGAYKIMKKGHITISPAQVNITIHSPILPERFQELDTKTLNDLVIDTISKSLDK